MFVLIGQIPDDEKPDTMFFDVKSKGYPLPTTEATSKTLVVAPGLFKNQILHAIF